MKYVVITPVRDEEQYMPCTLESMANQTVRPAQWIIVDDHSTDDTPEIVRRFSQEYRWIKLVEFDRQAVRQRGGRIVQLFYEGLKHIEDLDHDLVVKLDADLSFPKDYFERLIERFAHNPRLGIAGGECLEWNGDIWQLQVTPKEHVRGATKVYRKTCFDDIGGLVAVGGWDHIDELRAQMKGWHTRGFEDLTVRHHRPMGAAEGRLRAHVRQGQNSYFLGYPFPIIVARSVYRAVVDRPHVLGGVAMLWGFLQSWLGRRRQLDDPELRSYLRRQKWHQLVHWRPRVFESADVTERSSGP